MYQREALGARLIWTGCLVLDARAFFRGFWPLRGATAMYWFKKVMKRYDPNFLRFSPHPTFLRARQTPLDCRFS